MLLPFLLILSLIAKFIEVDISVPSFPDIANYFNTSEGTIQLTMSYNFLGFCLGGLLFGPMSECYGRRKITLIGDTLLLIGAIGCVFAPSIFWLLTFRFIQGIGASTSTVIFAIISDSYQGNRAVKFFGIMNSIVTIVMAIAPTLGNFIHEIVGWRGNYASVAIICFISWFSSLLLLPETKSNFNNFIFKEIINDYKKVLSSLKFMILSLVPSIFSAAYMSFVACGSFLYMHTFELPSSIYALHQGAIVMSFSLVSLFASKILQKIGTIKCITFGTIIISTGSLLLTIFSIIIPNSYYSVTISMVIFGIGCATCQAVIFNLSLNVFPNKGIASSAVSVIRALTIAIFIGITSYIYNGQTTSIAILILFAVVLKVILIAYLLYSNKLSNDTLLPN